MSPVQSERRSVIIVLGMHRSGTSATAGTLVKLGISPPKTPIPGNFANPRGYWESVPMGRFHDALLAGSGSSWSDWRPFNRGWLDTAAVAPQRAKALSVLRAEYNGAQRFVMKDPRMCRILDFWLPIFEDEKIDVKILMPYRTPLEVAYSLRRRDGFSISFGMALWLRHVLDAERASRRLNRSIISWHRARADWRPLLKQASDELGLALPVDDATKAAEVDAFITQDLWHERVDPQDGQTHPEMHEWASEAFSALEVLSGQPTDLAARTVLDQISNAFNSACGLFSRLSNDQEVRLLEMKSVLAAQEEKLAALEKQRQTENQTAAAALKQAQARIEVLEKVQPVAQPVPG